VEDVNDKFAILGSLLSISSYDSKHEYNSKSMHVDIKLKELRAPNRVSFYIPDNLAETIEFRSIYDFYYKTKVKKVFESIIKKQKNKNLKLQFEKSREKVQKAKTTKIQALMKKYNSDLKMKLKSLQNDNDII
jgi:ribosomal protein L32